MASVTICSDFGAHKYKVCYHLHCCLEALHFSVNIMVLKFIYVDRSCYCLVTQSCTSFCDLVDCSWLGFSIHGILQARILEWIAIFLSRCWQMSSSLFFLAVECYSSVGQNHQLFICLPTNRQLACFHCFAVTAKYIYSKHIHKCLPI